MTVFKKDTKKRAEPFRALEPHARKCCAFVKSARCLHLLSDSKAMHYHTPLQRPVGTTQKKQTYLRTLFHEKFGSELVNRVERKRGLHDGRWR